MGQEKHMALLGYDHLLLLLGHCGRFQDHYESTLVNDKENNEYSDDLSPLVNSFGDRALFFFFGITYIVTLKATCYYYLLPVSLKSHINVQSNILMVCLNNLSILILLFCT